MKVGSLGDIIFEVSDKVIKTFTDAEWSGSASIQKHNRHNSGTLVEFTGYDADGFTFSFKVSKHLGSDPTKDINKIIEYERAGKALTLMIGSKVYGDKWLISKHKFSLEDFDAKLNLVSADITLTLTEYLTR